MHIALVRLRSQLAAANQSEKTMKYTNTNTTGFGFTRLSYLYKSQVKQKINNGEG